MFQSTEDEFCLKFILYRELHKIMKDKQYLSFYVKKKKNLNARS